MHARKGNLADALAFLALSILERAAGMWRRAFFLALIAPLNDLSRTFSAKEAWAMIHHLYRSEACLARAIYRTARRIAGLPRAPLPVAAFYLPKLKSPIHAKHRLLRHAFALEHSRRLALRMVRRWRGDAERLARDPLADLRPRPAIRRRRIEKSGAAVIAHPAAASARIRAPP